jgi:hypothetical protein
MSEALYQKLFIASVCFLVALAAFVFGLAVGSNRIWPHDTVQPMWDAAQSLVRFGRIVPKNQLVPAPPDAPRQWFTIYDHKRVMQGYYVFLGWDDQSQQYGAWLYNNNGERLHTWTWHYRALDPDGPSDGFERPHGLAVLPDGSIILNFDGGDVMPRLDACSKPIWIKRGVYHHSLEKAEDGTFWTWRGLGSAYGHYNYLMKFDPETGETVEEIGLIEDIIRNMGPSAKVFGVRPDYPFRERFEQRHLLDSKYDIYHPNDVESLPSELAGEFAHFNAGDLLISLRNLDLIVVVDHDDKRVKWWHEGPWIRQHDPDFTKDGKISVYDNNTPFGRSEIIKIDPSTNELSNDLLHGDFRFFSGAMGKHQYLPNGNVLVVVSQEGRVVEVSPTGDKVLEFDNLAKETGFNGHVANGLWLDADYFKAFPACSAAR